MTENGDRLNIHDEIEALCAKLEIPPNMTMKILFWPDEVIATLFVPNAHGSPYIGDDGNAVTEQRTFKVLS